MDLLIVIQPFAPMVSFYHVVLKSKRSNKAKLQKDKQFCFLRCAHISIFGAIIINNISFLLVDEFGSFFIIAILNT